MPGRRDPIDRVVDLVVAVPASSLLAVRRAVPALWQAGVRRALPMIEPAVHPAPAERLFPERPPAASEPGAVAAVSDVPTPDAPVPVAAVGSRIEAATDVDGDSDSDGDAVRDDVEGGTEGGTEGGIEGGIEVPAGQLPIDDYDHLAARQIVDRLDDLRPDELAAVAAYESANRGRRTILHAIERLAS